MRVAVLALLGLMAGAPGAHGQEAATGWAAKLLRTDDGKIPTGHDFGTVPKGAVLRHRFPLTNIYAVPLQVVTSVDCGCVAASPTPQVLQPRETGVLDVTMDTTRFNGQKSVTLYVTVYSPNQQYSSTAVLRITGHCRLDVTLEPGQAIFGVVPRGQAVTREVLVRYAGAQNWQIAGVAPNESAPFDVNFQQAYRQGGQVGYRVLLTLKPDAAPGTHRGDLSLLTNDPNNRQVPIPYDVTVQAPLTASPDRHNLGTLKVGDAPATRKVLVRGSGRPFQIVGVDGQGDGLTVEYPATAAPVQYVTVRLQPTQPGPLRKALTIKTNLDGATATVNVEAVVQP